MGVGVGSSTCEKGQAPRWWDMAGSPSCTCQPQKELTEARRFGFLSQHLHSQQMRPWAGKVLSVPASVTVTVLQEARLLWLPASDILIHCCLFWCFG